MEQQNKLIDQFHKNSAELVEVNLTEFRGQEYVDVRIWNLPNPAEPGTEQPTKKGICISIDLLPRLIAALQKAGQSLGDISPIDARSDTDEGKCPNEQTEGPGE